MTVARGLRHVLLRAGRAALLVALLEFLTLEVVGDAQLPVPFWAPAGVAFALAYVDGAVVLPGVFLGLLAGQWSGDALPTSPVLVVGTALAVTLQAGVAAWIVRRVVGPLAALDQVGEVVRFLVFAGPVGSVLSSSIITGLRLAVGTLTTSDAPASWFSGWSADTIGILLIAPVVLMALRVMENAWEGRRLAVAGPALVIALVAFASFLQSTALVAQELSLRAQTTADLAQMQLQQTLDRHMQLLMSTAGLFRATDAVTPAGFERFAQPLLHRNASLRALEWAPLVPQAQRAAFEARQRRLLQDPAFHLTEHDATGAMVPAAARPEHVVVTYIQPLAGNAPALGYDLASNPSRAAAIARATRTGLPAATAPITLVQAQGSQTGMLIVDPVMAPSGGAADRRVLGYGVGVYAVGDMLREVYRSVVWNNVRVTVSDATHPQAEVPIATRFNSVRGGSSESLDRYISVAGRTWRMRVEVFALRPSQQIAGSTLFQLLAVLVVGLIMAFLLLVTGLYRTAERRARSLDYAATHDPLTDLFNRRALLERLELLRSIELPPDHAHVLLFLDLDDFKLVNDGAGHAAGDRMLRLVGDALSGLIRRTDMVARLGGDEFAVLLEDCPPAKGREIADNVVRSIDALRVEAGPQRYTIGVSVGMVVVRHGTQHSVDEVLHEADVACYAAKRSGKHRVVEADLA